MLTTFMFINFAIVTLFLSLTGSEYLCSIIGERLPSNRQCDSFSFPGVLITFPVPFIFTKMFQCGRNGPKHARFPVQPGELGCAGKILALMVEVKHTSTITFTDDPDAYARRYGAKLEKRIAEPTRK